MRIILGNNTHYITKNFEAGILILKKQRNAHNSRSSLLKIIQKRFLAWKKMVEVENLINITNKHPNL